MMCRRNVQLMPTLFLTMERLWTLNTTTLTQTSGAEARTNDLESRIEVIQGQAFWDDWKVDEGLRITL